MIENHADLVAKGYERSLRNELAQIPTLRQLLNRKAHRKLEARIMLFEMLRRQLLKVVDADGADVYSSEGNFLFAYAVCLSQLGHLGVRPIPSQDVVGKLRNYHETLQGGYVFSFKTNLNEEVVDDFRRMF